ncbi:MAG: DUF1553 domain-containing protein, partial [Planctomycetaceae bacterium]|nr:DUF1553 domain-containing protein [Planctomycetaceae bacterium]
ECLSLSEPADPRTFIRRATFDLWGLPPTPEDVAAFESDCRDSAVSGEDGLPDAAVRRLIDRLLDSPRYGERWARHWLDIAHYADTHGFERDQIRQNAWRYRDYVIDALNADRPYDQFLREQIAGDVIAPDDPQAVIATGFLAAGPWDFVGQVETRSEMLRRAARAEDLDDMVTQVMSATMGLTVNCARCHDHKLDPISQEEYYALWAVFAGVRRGERNVSDEEVRRQEETKKQLTEQLADTSSQIARLAVQGVSLADIVSGGDGHGTGSVGTGIDLRTGQRTSEKLGYHRDITTNRLQKLQSEQPPDDADRLVKWVFVADGRSPVLVDDQQEVQGVPATSGHFWDVIRHGPLNSQVSTTIAGTDYATAGHSILGLHANGGITFDLARIRRAGMSGPMRLTGVAGFGSGSGGAGTNADFSVFVDTELRLQKLRMGKDESMILDIAIPAEARTLTLIATDGGDGIGHDLMFIGDAQLRPETIEELSDDDRRLLAELRQQSEELRADLAELKAPQKVYAVVSETPAEIHVLHRGSPENAGAVVTPGGPSCVTHQPAGFGDNTTGEGERRRRLAEWITHPDNPLTRRVLVNRLWHHHFGQGLVNTPSDLGFGGDRPSHPELLDWLAEQVLVNEWSTKQLHRLLMTSATYRQASTERDHAASVDAQNRLLWRQNPRRLDAESIHDAVLAVTGKLNLEMGGPGFRDFEYTEAYAPIYRYVTPDRPELWRRSIYRFVVRTTPHQFMSTLDCPDPANLTPARVTTTTALQALTLSNNEFMLQQAQYLAGRLQADAASLPEQIDRAFQLTFQRLPTDDERTASRTLILESGLFPFCRAL